MCAVEVDRRFQITTMYLTLTVAMRILPTALLNYRDDIGLQGRPSPRGSGVVRGARLDGYDSEVPHRFSEASRGVVVGLSESRSGPVWCLATVTGARWGRRAWRTFG